MQNHCYLLAKKIAIATGINPNSSNTNYRFYSRYSDFTLRALRKNAFQEFIADMLKSECIPQKNIASVRIEFFPALKRNGLTIAGKCDTTKGKIRIYPKPIRFCDVFRKEYGRHILVAYAGNRARAALIHELLHLKYKNDEDQVKKLTKKYYFEFINRGSASSSSALSAYKLIFARIN